MSQVVVVVVIIVGGLFFLCCNILISLCVCVCVCACVLRKNKKLLLYCHSSIFVLFVVETAVKKKSLPRSCFFVVFVLL